MNKMSELITTTQLVKAILEEDEKARNSDDYLYLQVCKQVNPRCSMFFDYVMLHRKELGIPGYETVRRTRQKIQQEFPELCGSDRVNAMRAVREEEFREYARGGV